MNQNQYKIAAEQSEFIQGETLLCSIHTSTPGRITGRRERVRPSERAGRASETGGAGEREPSARRHRRAESDRERINLIGGDVWSARSARWRDRALYLRVISLSCARTECHAKNNIHEEI